MTVRPVTIHDALMRALECQARYLTYTAPTTIYCCVDADFRNVLVGVFGDGANGAYEWFIWDDDAATVRTSNDGWGNPGVALCSGLVEAGARRANGDHEQVLAWVREEDR